MTIDQNPFAVLTFIAAPAVLTNACSVLALGTSNRFARNVDRARQLIRLLGSRDVATDVEARMFRRQLGLAEQRASLLVRAMSALYFSIGAFAAGSLLSLLGAILSATEHASLLRPVLIVAILIGVAGLVSLIVGGGLLVRETRLALRTIHQEALHYRQQYPTDMPGDGPNPATSK